MLGMMSRLFPRRRRPAGPYDEVLAAFQAWAKSHGELDPWPWGDLDGPYGAVRMTYDARQAKNTLTAHLRSAGGTVAHATWCEGSRYVQVTASGVFDPGPGPWVRALALAVLDSQGAMEARGAEIAAERSESDAEREAAREESLEKARNEAWPAPGGTD